MKTVYVVHCVDTEGPLYESIEATFDRIKDIFDLEFDVSRETLRKLQKKEIDLGGKEDAIFDLVAPKRINTNDTWDKIDDMLDCITSNEFRKKYCDSVGSGWVFNWFCMDNVGFNGNNPRRRDLGHHNIFDHYGTYLRLNKQGDLIQWHYHPLAIINNAHNSGTTYLNSSNVFDILARKVIDRMWFPAVNRPGFHTERPDSHWFFEQWIPFDYANQSTRKESTNQPDLAGERFGDWRRAPISWIPYHPDHSDYQKVGNCNRYIARCLNMEARLRELCVDDVRDAFKEARERGSSLLSFTNHDFRDMVPEIEKVWKMIDDVGGEFEDVEFKFVNAIEGMRKVLGLNDLKAPEFDVTLEKSDNKSVLRAISKNGVFGVQPFLAIKTKTKEYYWENFDFVNENEWTYTFDYNNVEICAIEKIGVASNTPAGVTEVVVLDVETGEKEKKVLNQDF